MPGSPDPRGALDRATPCRLFDELAEELARVRTRAHVYIVGGGAMTMAYQRDRATHDVDAGIEDDHAAVLRAVHAIARRHGLPGTWLNERAAAFLPHAPDRRAAVVYDSPHLVITGTSAEHPLAMKLEAARGTDRADIATLLRILRIRDPDAAMDIHAELFPDSPHAARAHALIDAVLAEHAHPDPAH